MTRQIESQREQWPDRCASRMDWPARDEPCATCGHSFVDHGSLYGKDKKDPDLTAGACGVTHEEGSERRLRGCGCKYFTSSRNAACRTASDALPGIASPALPSLAKPCPALLSPVKINRVGSYYTTRLRLNDGTPEVSIPADIYRDARAHADALAQKHGLILVEPDRSPDDIGRGNTYLHAYKDGQWVGNIAIEKPGDLAGYGSGMSPEYKYAADVAAFRADPAAFIERRGQLWMEATPVYPDWVKTEDGWVHPSGGVLRQTADGKYQMYGPAVTMNGGDGPLVPIKQPSEDPQPLMDWWDWTEGAAPKPAGVHFWGMQREAAWTDVRQKALRLRREGRVHVNDIGQGRIYATVEGDHGTYDTMILKGGSMGGWGGGQSITNWHCACLWGQWAFKRRFSYVGRLCSHGYAAYLEMQAQHMKKHPEHFRPHRPVYATFNQDTVDRLQSEFEDWAPENAETNTYGGSDRGPIGYWPNVEKFFKDKYPAVARGLDTGWEEASPVLDKTLGYDVPSSSVGRTAPYETGPEAIDKYGYDPAEIAAGMLLLHNQSHPFRGDMLREDQQRLVDVAVKREKMQQAYDKKPHQLQFDYTAALQTLHLARHILGECPPGDPACAAGITKPNTVTDSKRAPGSADASSLDDRPTDWEMPPPGVAEKALADMNNKPNSGWGGHAYPSSLAGETGSGTGSGEPSGGWGGSGSGSYTPGTNPVTNLAPTGDTPTKAEEKAYAESLFKEHGWGPEQIGPLDQLWNHESGDASNPSAPWNPEAHNQSGASGIAQFMPYTAPYYTQGNENQPWQSQIAQGEQYIQDRYQNPSGAWNQYYNHPNNEGSY
jgi:hypothetical protein